ncbi:MAG: hypothetical protein DRJ69_02175 [Thermoprotei archaeon]|nr:MAG: hypothetical protein DRJ69_02175 [Thermoprotei archaeon]
MVCGWQYDFQDGKYDGWIVTRGTRPEYTSFSITSGNSTVWDSTWNHEKKYSRYVNMSVWGAGDYVRFRSPKTQSSYFSFRSINAAEKWDGYGELRVWYLNNSENTLNKSANLADSLYNNIGALCEVVFLNKHAYFFVNGTLIDQKYIGDEYAHYIMFDCYYGANWHIDDITTEPYAMIDLGEYFWDWNATELDDDEIDVYWTIPLYFDEENDEYTIKVRRLLTGAIVNTTDITSEAKSKGAGVVVYNRTETLGYNYGLYVWEIEKNGQLHDYATLYYMPPYETSYLAFDRETYASGQTVTITYDIANPDFSSHNYYIKILDIYGNEKKRWHITKESGNVTFNSNELDVGIYYAVLVQYSEPVELAYDVMQIEERVDIEGVSYDAKNECVLGSVNVNASQGTTWHNTTTDATTGYYNLTDFIMDEAIQMNASKANYTHNNFSFTPLQSGLYEINLFLLPDETHINVTAPAIVGLTQLYPFYQNVSYATVNIWNETWNASTTTNSMGYFAFENLTPGTYYLNATHIKCKPSETYEVNLSSGEIEYVYILMHGLYNLTIKARDASTHATIFNFQAILNDGEQTKNTTVGWLNFTNVEYGIHKVEVGADGYYSAIEYVYVYGDVEKIVYLTPLEAVSVEQGLGISYPPHQVEFVCVDLFGNPLTNIRVEATPISTTTGSWDWLLKLFGIRNESITYFTNQTLNGTTDSRGAVTFVMMENVEYEVRFVNESLGIDKTIRIYPKADHYTVILTSTTSSVVSSEDYITFNLSYEIIGDEINLSLVYNDALAQTQNLTFFVYNSTSLLYQQNFTNVSNVTVSYTVPYKAGEEYMWGYSAFHSRFGEMGRSRILRIVWFLDLGISRTYCTWIAIAIILFLTAMFSFTTVKFGYITIPVVSLIFAYIGWLPNMSIIIIALCLGILAYMSKREKEVGV